MYCKTTRLSGNEMIERESREAAQIWIGYFLFWGSDESVNKVHGGMLINRDDSSYLFLAFYRWTRTGAEEDFCQLDQLVPLEGKLVLWHCTWEI